MFEGADVAFTIASLRCFGCHRKKAWTIHLEEGGWASWDPTQNDAWAREMADAVAAEFRQRPWLSCAQHDVSVLSLRTLRVTRM